MNFSRKIICILITFKGNIRCYHCKGNHNTALCYQRQNRNSYNDGVQRNPINYHKRHNKGIKLTKKIKSSIKREKAKKI